MIGLEFGCGDNPQRKNFSGVDIRPGQYVEYVCNAWEIDTKVDSGSIDCIYSRHFFEHLSNVKADLTLRSWHKILKPGGKVEMIVPDIIHHMKQLIEFNETGVNRIVKRFGASNSTILQEGLKGLWGGQRCQTSNDVNEQESYWDCHKWGYFFYTLREKVIQHGFKDIKRIDDGKAKNLYVVFYK